MKNLPPSSDVAANVRHLRQLRGWTLAQLSDRLREEGHALSLPVLSKIELGDRGISVDDLVAFGDAFGVATGLLLEDPARVALIMERSNVQELLSEREKVAAAVDHSLRRYSVVIAELASAETALAHLDAEIAAVQRLAGDED